LKDEQESDSENMEDNIDGPYSVIEPMVDLCNEYVNFLMEEEKNKNMVIDEVKEVHILY